MKWHQWMLLHKMYAYRPRFSPSIAGSESTMGWFVMKEILCDTDRKAQWKSIMYAGNWFDDKCLIWFIVKKVMKIMVNGGDCVEKCEKCGKLFFFANLCGSSSIYFQFPPPKYPQRTDLHTGWEILWKIEPADNTALTSLFKSTAGALAILLLTGQRPMKKSLNKKKRLNFANCVFHFHNSGFFISGIRGFIFRNLRFLFHNIASFITAINNSRASICRWTMTCSRVISRASSSGKLNETTLLFFP